MAKKEEHKHELLENPEALKEKLAGAETWLETNPKIVIGVALAILLTVGGYFAFQFYKDSQDEQAQNVMFQAVFYFEALPIIFATRDFLREALFFLIIPTLAALSKIS